MVAVWGIALQICQFYSQHGFCPTTRLCNAGMANGGTLHEQPAVGAACGV
jgi:hypothetical protein